MICPRNTATPGGAVVKGGVRAQGSNITIRGRGILDGLDWPQGKGPTRNIICLDHCTGVRVEDVIAKDSWNWCLRMMGCEQVTVSNLKIVSTGCQYNDGFDICNSRQVTIEDCFARTEDDTIATKGFGYRNGLAVEDITVTRSVLWVDQARVWRLVCECRAEAMRNMTFRDIDVIRSGGVFDCPTISLQPAEDMPMYDLRFEDIRINGEGKSNLIEVYPHFERWSKKKTPGSIRNVYFRDIVVHGVSPQGRLGRICVEGRDAGHTVENVTFDNVVRYGLSTRADSPEVEVKGRVHNVTFKPRAFETPDAGGAPKNPQK